LLFPLLLACVIPSGFESCRPAGGASNEDAGPHAPVVSALAALPTDLDMAGEVDLQALRSSPLFQRLVEDELRQLDASLAGSCGPALLERVERVTFGTRAGRRGDQRVVAVFQGSLTEAELFACLFSEDPTRLRVRREGRRTLILSRDETALVVLAPGVYLFGHEEFVMESLAVLDAAQASLLETPLPTDALDNVPASHAFRAVLFCNERTQRSSEGCGSPDSEGVLATAFGISMRTELVVDARIVYRDATTARDYGVRFRDAILRKLELSPTDVQVSLTVDGPHVDVKCAMSEQTVLEAIERRRHR